jgi:beta-galactosidase/beta-glucuronidase
MTITQRIGFSALFISFMTTLACATAIPSDRGRVVALDGTWRFKLEQGSDFTGDKGRTGGQPNKSIKPEKFEPFERPDYREDDGWKDIAVPGNWEMQGFSPATYNQPDNCIGIYRKWIDVPKEWAGQIVKIDFDGVQNAAEVYLNGQPVKVDEPTQGRENYHQGGFTAFQADLTPAVKFGERNLLAVRVYKNPEFVNLDTGDYFFLGGIHRTVKLFAVPATHIDDYKVETRLLEGGKAEVKVIATVVGGAGASVVMRLKDEGDADGPVDEKGRVVLTRVVEKPRLWSAEHPNLYDLALEVKDRDGKVTQTVSSRIGIREVSIKDGVLLVNNVPMKLTGMCRHDLSPTLGSALNEEVWRKDILTMKAANVNAIRTSHYPYGRGFYELCDELGMYVADEVAAGWTPADEPRLYPAWQQHARETIRRDKNHPSILIWAIGNENKPGDANRLAAEEIHKLDTTRPRLASWRKAEDSGVELDDLHYTNPDKIQKLNDDIERRKTIPMIFLENPNVWEARNGADWGCLERWAPVMDRTWKVVWEADHVPGSFLWEWRDRAVADPYPKKLYDFDPATGIHLVKVKGICDGYCTPRPTYYHVKMAYAPIKLDVDRAQKSADAVIVPANNGYSFTNLSELKTTWRLTKDGKPVGEGDAKLELAPREKGDLRIPLPPDKLAGADAVEVNFTQPDGRDVATYALRLAPEKQDAPALASPDVTFPRLNFVTVDWGRNEIGGRSAQRHPMKLSSIRTSASANPIDEAALYAMPLATVRELEADVADEKGEQIGRVSVRRDGKGSFAYKLMWTAKTPGEVQELGWSFAAPASADRFSWKRQGYWSWYPPDHIGRPRGTATPDSAKGSPTRMDRPDQFDFNSTKYDCDWATMLDDRGRGIGVRFDGKQRHHVRGDVGKDGAIRLIVNRQVSPPRDISSPIVSDLYMNLEAGQDVAGTFLVGAVHQETHQ